MYICNVTDKEGGVILCLRVCMRRTFSCFLAGAFK